MDRSAAKIPQAPSEAIIAALLLAIAMMANNPGSPAMAAG